MHFCDFAPLYQNTRTYRFTNPNPTRSRRGRSSPAFQRGQPLLLQTGKRHRPGPALPSAPPHRHDYRRPPAGEAASHRAVTHEGRPSADRRLPTTGPPRPVPSPFASAALPAAGGSRPRSASDTPRRPARSPRPRRVPPLSPPPLPFPGPGDEVPPPPAEARPGPARPAGAPGGVAMATAAPSLTFLQQRPPPTVAPEDQNSSRRRPHLLPARRRRGSGGHGRAGEAAPPRCHGDEPPRRPPALSPILRPEGPLGGVFFYLRVIQVHLTLGN